jgi:phenylacetate-CoA ligase
VDNQPVSILEAFAAGLPVVSTPTGDIRAMVRHTHTGLIVPVGDAASLASAVLWLTTHPGEASSMAQQARQDVTRYTWLAVRDQWAAVYDGPRGTTPAGSPARPHEVDA